MLLLLIIGSLAIGIFSSLLLTRTEYHVKMFNNSKIAYNLIQEKAFVMGINDLFLLSTTIIVLIVLPLCLILKKEDDIKELHSNEIKLLN